MENQMATMLPVDGDNNTIPVLSLRPGASQNVAVTASSARSATAFNTDTRVIGLYATVPMFIRLGDNTVTATTSDHYLPADTYMDVSVAANEKQKYTAIAAIRNSSDGTLYISEKI
jgi:hypothetical protein